MTRLEALLARVNMPAGGVPQVLTGLSLTIHYAQGAVDRGSVASMLDGLNDECQAIIPLFAAGFAGAGPVASFAIKVSQPGHDMGLIEVSGAAHDSRLLFLLLRLIEAGHQTPPGAWERLLYSLDGDEDEARAAFNPRNLAQDVLGIFVTLQGHGATRPFDLAMPQSVAELAPLTLAIAHELPQTDILRFTLPSHMADTGALEHGFLTFQNAGVFSQLNDSVPHRPGEPEIMVEPAGQGAEVTVEDWTDAPVFLAEYLRVLAGGQAESVAVIRVEDAD
jgi:hypothetical protein